MAQAVTLKLLKEIGHPATPSEVSKYTEEKGLADPSAENRGRINRDLKHLKKWGLVIELPGALYIPAPAKDD